MAGVTQQRRWCALEICHSLHPADPCDEPCDACWAGAAEQMREAQDDGTMINAPWTDEQIAALRAHQDNPMLHPYTCGTDSRHRPLVPTRDGWRCLDCDYKQNWAHAHIPSASESSPPRDLVERLIDRRDDLSVEAAEVIIGLRGALSRFRQWMRDAKELPNVQP